MSYPKSNIEGVDLISLAYRLVGALKGEELDKSCEAKLKQASSEYELKVNEAEENLHKRVLDFLAKETFIIHNDLNNNELEGHCMIGLSPLGITYKYEVGDDGEKSIRRIDIYYFGADLNGFHKQTLEDYLLEK